MGPQGAGFIKIQNWQKKSHAKSSPEDECSAFKPQGGQKPSAYSPPPFLYLLNPRTPPLHPIDLPHNVPSRRNSSSRPPIPPSLPELCHSQGKCSTASLRFHWPKRLSLPTTPKIRWSGLLLCLSIFQTPRRLPTPTFPRDAATTYGQLHMGGYLRRAF